MTDSTGVVSVHAKRILVAKMPNVTQLAMVLIVNASAVIPAILISSVLVNWDVELTANVIQMLHVLMENVNHHANAVTLPFAKWRTIKLLVNVHRDTLETPWLDVHLLRIHAFRTLVASMQCVSWIVATRFVIVQRV